MQLGLKAAPFHKQVPRIRGTPDGAASKTEKQCKYSVVHLGKKWLESKSKITYTVRTEQIHKKETVCRQFHTHHYIKNS